MGIFKEPEASQGLGEQGPLYNEYELEQITLCVCVCGVWRQSFSV